MEKGGEGQGKAKQKIKEESGQTELTPSWQSSSCVLRDRGREGGGDKDESRKVEVEERERGDALLLFLQVMGKEGRRGESAAAASRL